MLQKSITFALFLMVGVGLQGAPGPEPQTPQNLQTEEPLTFYITKTKLEPLRLTEQFYGRLKSVEKVDSEPIASDVKLITAGASHVIDLPPLRVGDIIPAFKGVYRVSAIDSMPQQRVAFERLTAKNAVLLNGAIVEHKLCYSLNMDVMGLLNSRSYTSKYGSDAQGDYVLLSPRNSLIGKKQLRVGDYIESEHTKRKVVRIIPPDPKVQIHGWFELGDEEPIKRQ